jgi:hypothetical protein
MWTEFTDDFAVSDRNLLGSFKGREFLDYLNDFHILKDCSFHATGSKLQQ